MSGLGVRSYFALLAGYNGGWYPPSPKKVCREEGLAGVAVDEAGFLFPGPLSVGMVKSLNSSAFND